MDRLVCNGLVLSYIVIRADTIGPRSVVGSAVCGDQLKTKFSKLIQSILCCF